MEDKPLPDGDQIQGRPAARGRRTGFRSKRRAGRSRRNIGPQTTMKKITMDAKPIRTVNIAPPAIANVLTATRRKPAASGWPRERMKAISVQKPPTKSNATSKVKNP